MPIPQGPGPAASTSSWAARPRRSRSPRPPRRATRTWRPTASRTSTTTPTSPTPTAAPARSAPAASRRRRRSDNGRVRVDHLRRPRAPGHRVRRPRPPDAAAARPEHARHDRQLSAAAAHAGRGRPVTNFAGGGYFYLDDQDRAVVPTTSATSHRRRRAAPRSCPTATIDVTGGRADRPDHLRPARLDGRIWFATKAGVDGHRRPATGAVHALAAGRADRQLVRRGRTTASTSSPTARCTSCEAGADGTPAIVWRRAYDNDGDEEVRADRERLGHHADAHRPRATWRSPTTPTRSRSWSTAAPATARRVLPEPVFDQGASSTDQSLIATGRRSSPRTTSATRARPRPRTGTRQAGPPARRRPRREGAPRPGAATRSRPPPCRSSRSPTACSTRTPSPRATTARTPGTSRRSTRAPGRRLQAPRRRGPGLQQQLRADHARARRRGVSRELGGIVVVAGPAGAPPVATTAASRVALRVRCLRRGRARLT